jgi:DNA-binding response OmpR family regulator
LTAPKNRRYPNTNIVDVYIGYLRRKPNRPDDPVPIFAVRTVGYRLGDGA